MRGVCGRRNTIASGELGADVGVSGRAIRRAECVEALEDGRDMGRRVGVRNRNGTLSTSSRCLCMRSRTCWESWEKAAEHSRGNGERCTRTNLVVVVDGRAKAVSEEVLELLLMLRVEQ